MTARAHYSRDNDYWTDLQSKTIDCLRFPMAVAVVVLHQGSDSIVGATGALRCLCVFFSEGICRLAVPLFFFVSGYLFFNNLNDWSWTAWRVKIRHRVKSLFIPYFLWNSIAFLVFWGFSFHLGNGMSFCQYFHKVGGVQLFWNTGSGIPFGGTVFPLDSPLWFIRDLMVYTLLTPVIYTFIKGMGLTGYVVVLGIFVIVSGLIPEGFVFFLTGSVLQINGKNIVRIIWDKRIFFYTFASVFLIALLITSGYSQYWSRFFKILFLFFGIGASFCVMASLILKDLIRNHSFLVRSSFFIFASHRILIHQSLVSPLVNHILPSSIGWDCLEFFITPAIVVLFCLGLFALMELVLPRTTKTLIGER